MARTNFLKQAETPSRTRLLLNRTPSLQGPDLHGALYHSWGRGRKKMHKKQGWIQPKVDCQERWRVFQRVDWGWRQSVKSRHSWCLQEKSFSFSFLVLRHSWDGDVRRLGEKNSEVLSADESQYCISIRKERKSGEERVWSASCCLIVLVYCVVWSSESMHSSTRRFCTHNAVMVF